MKINYLLITIAALLVACSPSPNKKMSLSDNSLAIPVIDIDEGLSNITKTPFKCSEFIEDIQYVTLESSKNSLFGNGKFAVSIMSSPEFVYCQLMKFSLKDGKFIQQIGKQGRGPGEFLMALSSTIDYVNNRVFVLDNYGDQILIYDKDNNFIKKLNVPNEVQSIKYLGDDKLILFRSFAWFFLNSIPFDYLIYDINTEQILYTRRLETVIDFMKENKQDFYNLFGYPSIDHWYYDNKIQFYEGFSDTIFTINTDGSRMPRLYIKRDSYKPSLFDMLNNDSYQKNKSKYAKVRVSFETPRFLFMNIYMDKPNYSYCGRYDKLNQKLTVIPLIGAFINDIAFFQFTSLQNNPEASKGIGYLSIPLNKTEFLLNMKQTLKNSWSESAQKLYDLIQKANPEDNGIICIYKLKSN
jgi:hypothetical protein